MTNLKQLLEVLWNEISERLNTPMKWIHLLFVAKPMLQDELVETSDIPWDKLESLMKKCIRPWYRNYDNWTALSWPELWTKVAGLVAGTLANVYVFRDERESEEHFRLLSRYGAIHRGVLFIIVCEGLHIYLIHDCPYSNKSCRCSFVEVQGLRYGFCKHYQPRPYIADMSGMQWDDIFVYFVLSKWSHEREVWVGEELFRLPSTIEALQ